MKNQEEQQINRWDHLDKKKDHIVGIESTEEEHHDEIHDDENDVLYDSIRDLEDLDSNHNGEETISDIAISNKDDEDNLRSLKKQLGERMKALDTARIFLVKW